MTAINKNQTLKFYDLAINQVINECSDVIVLEFIIPNDLKDIFVFKPGQHLTLKVLINNEEVRRSYSICNLYESKNLMIAIKKVNDGLFSSFAFLNFKKGMSIAVMPPSGHFFLEDLSDIPKHFLAIAAGSGITPVISMISHYLLAMPEASFTLFYGSKKRGNVLFADQLDVIKNTYLERFSLHYFITEESSEVDFFNGRMDSTKINNAIEDLLSNHLISDAFICGPNEMIDNAITQLKMKGLRDNQIHFERFGVPKTNLVEKNKGHLKDQKSAGASTITMMMDGIQRQFVVNPDENLLDVSIQSGFDLPYSCKAGVCCTCKARVTKGKVNMHKNYSLGADEVKDGYVLTCQAIPMSPEVTISFDE